MSIFKRIKGKKDAFNGRIDSAISTDLNGFQRMMVFLDCAVEYFFHKITTKNYFLYGFYGKSQKQRRQFIGQKEMHLVYDVCNAPDDRRITGNKVTFNKRCGALIGRKWLDTTTAEFDEFQAFAKELDRFFAKPMDGGSGRGAGIIELHDTLNYREEFEDLKAQKAIVEEVVTQHPEIAAFHPSSINTMRLATLRDAHNTVHVMAATMRIGTGRRVVDNFHSKGIAAVIDINSGVLTSWGMDAAGKRYLCHPDTNKQIKGFQIPYWERIVCTAVNAAELLPELRYVGWDMALDREGNPVIIEANAMPDFDLLQGPSQEGLWPMYKPIIEELQKKGLSKE